MALTDALGTFTSKSGQSITASAASTDVVDLGAPGTPAGHSTALTRDIGIGARIPIICKVTEAFATCDSLKVAVQVDNDEAFGSATTVYETEAIAVASLVAGYKFLIDYIPRGTNERYLRLYFTIAGSNATAGKVFAAISQGEEYGLPY